MGKDEKLLSDLQQAGDESHDRVWPLPFFEEYHEWIKGDVSDLTNVPKNSLSRIGGAITAGAFLSNFVKKARWAHIDIAGPAYLPDETDYGQMYASGAGVRLLSYYLMKK